MNTIQKADISPDMTLTQWLLHWFETYVVRNVKRSTAVSYQGIINNHIAPKIGSYKLCELNIDILQTFFNTEADSGNAKGGGLSPKTLQNIKRMLHKALKKAAELELVTKNYSDYVDIPSVDYAEMRVLTVEEEQRLVSVLTRSDNPMDLGMLIALALGLRLGEVLGLQWRDIDTKNKVVHIRRTVNRLPTLDDPHHTEMVIGTPKSKKSKRDIPITDDFLKLFKKFTARTHMRYGSRSDEDYIFHGLKASKPCEPKNMQRHFKKVVIEELDIKGATFHSLRHTFATRAIEKGVDVKTLSELLGHSDVSITLNRYAHVLDEHKRNTMAILLSSVTV